MNNPCPNRTVCPGTDSPLTNYTYDDPDLIVFRNLAYPIFDPTDPLGGGGGSGPPSLFFAFGCLTLCESTVSQEAADLCAQNAALQCTYGHPTHATFTNSLAQCSSSCPDGSTFTWTILPGTFFAPTQALADALAQTLACSKAGALFFCLGPAPVTICKGSQISITIPITGANPGPFDPEVVAGNLPAGTFLGAGPHSVTISGTPSATGPASFTLRVTDPGGNQVEKNYTINVLGINETSMPNGTLNAPYSMQFTASGGQAPYHFSLGVPQQSPALPCGIGSNFTPAGLFTCTPNANGSYVLAITVTDATGVSCITAFSWQVGFCNTAISQTTGFCPSNPGLTFTGSVPQGAFCASSQAQADALAQAALVNLLTTGLSGLGCPCAINVDATTNQISTSCNLCFNLMANGNLIAPPNHICINQLNFDPDAFYFGLTGNHLPPTTVFVPTNFTYPSFQFHYPPI